MKYKVIIRKCSDPQTASVIAGEIARWSGSTVEVVMNVITQKTVCIRKVADEAEAHRLQEQFGAVGAQVELVPLGQTQIAAAPAAVANAIAVTRSTPEYVKNDDEDEPGRVLTEAEYAEMLKSRNDIFKIERNNRLNLIETACMIVAIFAGVWLSTREIIQVATDFLENIPEERAATLVKTEVDAAPERRVEEKKNEDIKNDRKELKPKNTNAGTGGTQSGGGDPRTRVTNKGILGIISGQIKGKTVASADIFGKGGFATNIDAILLGVSGLKSEGSGGVGRKGAASIGFGTGYGPGFGGGAGSIDDLIGSLFYGDDGSGLDLKRPGTLRVSAPEIQTGGALTAGRSKAGIQRVVLQNLAALRYAYNKRLREKPGLGGTITVKFAIDEFGKVIFCSVVESKMGDSDLEQTIVAKIKLWKFEKIDKPGDVTEVLYPFTFAQ